MSFPRYAEYKDSCVKELGAIPVDWNILRIKYLTKCLDGQRVPLNAIERGEKKGDIPYWGANKIVDYVNDWLFDEELILLGEDGAPFFDKFKDVAFAVNGRIWPNNHVHVLRPFKKVVNTKFLTYALNCTDYSLYISGSTRDKLNQSDMNNILIRLPPVSEQEAIINFLDHETAKLDNLINEQKKLIELLKEKRQAVISHAVTKGLNPNAPMKDSGVEWLGKVPEHWGVQTIAKATKKITNGFVGPTRDILFDEGLPYIQATHIKHGRVNFGNDYYVKNEWSNAHSKSILKAGDVLIVQTGAGTGDVGLVTEQEEGYNCHALIILQSDETLLIGSYLSLLLQSEYGKSKLESVQTGAMHPHLNCGEVKFLFTSPYSGLKPPPLGGQIYL